MKKICFFDTETTGFPNKPQMMEDREVENCCYCGDFPELDGRLTATTFSRKYLFCGFCDAIGRRSVGRPARAYLDAVRNWNKKQRKILRITRKYWERRRKRVPRKTENRRGEK